MPLYELFLSYHRADEQRVSDIRNLLEAAGIRTFMDKEALRAGLPWPKALEDGLSGAKAVAAFIGAEIGAWQAREIAFALDRQADAEKTKGPPYPVIPVLLPECRDLGIVPGFLKLNTWVDLRSYPYNPDQLKALREAVNGTTEGQKILAPATVSPYRGLYEFREQDVAFFFGRESFTARLFKAVDTRPIVCLIGNSGSGKSSVAKAGLVPLLRRQRPPKNTWETLLCRPEKTPFYAMAQAVAPLLYPDVEDDRLIAKAVMLAEDIQSGERPFWAVIKTAFQKSNGTDRLLLVIDQFEEIFLTENDAARLSFVKCLLEALKRTDLRVLIIVRADFYGRVIGESRELSDLIEPGIVNVGSLTPDELRRAIEEPARLVGLEFEDGLVQRILDDAGNEPGNLPLVEFALAELSGAGRRRGNTLTHAGYDDIDQIAGSIAKRADEVFDNLTDEQRAIAPTVFPRLVRVALPGEGAQDTRQIADVSDLTPAARAVIDAFVKARLLVIGRDAQTGRELAQVAHEALIRKWHKLQQWLGDQRQFLLWRQRINQRIQEWRDTSRDEGALIYGALLAEARTWRERCRGELTDQERDYLAASEDAERKSSQVEQQALALRLATESERILNEEPAELERALLLAMEALRRLPVLATHDNFMRVFHLLPIRIGNISVEPPLVDASFSPDGKWIVATSESGEIRILDGQEYGERFRLSAGGKPGRPVFSSDSKYVGVPVGDSDVVVWELATGLLAARVTHTGAPAPNVNKGPGGTPDLMSYYIENMNAVTNIAFAQPHGQAVFATANRKFVQVNVWRLPGGEHASATGHEQGVTCLAYHPAHGFMAGLRDGRIWCVDEFILYPGLTGQKGTVTAICFSPDEKYWVLGNGEGPATMVDVADKHSRVMLPQNNIKRIQFNGSGEVFAALSDSGEIRVWRTQNREELARIRWGGAIQSIDFSPSGSRLLVAGNDRTSRIFQVPGGTEVARMAHPDAVVSACFGQTEDVRLTASKDGRICLWRATYNGRAGIIQHSDPSTPAVLSLFRKMSFALSPDGARIVSIDSGGSLCMWPVPESGPPDTTTVQGLPVLGPPQIVFSPTGGQLLINRETDALVVDAVSLKEVRTLTHPAFETSPYSFALKIDRIAFSPDGTAIATSHAANSTRVWNAETGELLFEKPHLPLQTQFAFSPNAKLFATQTSLGGVAICELPGGRQVSAIEEPKLGSLVFSEDSTTLATVGSDGIVRLWDGASGTCTLQVNAGKPVYAITMVSRLDLLVTACEDGTLAFWSLSNGQLRQKVEHATAKTPSSGAHDIGAKLIPIPGRDYLASFGRDRGILRIYDLRNQTELCRVRRSMADAAFSPDGRLLYFGDGFRTIESWFWHPDELLGSARSMLSRNLTEEEWSRYIGNEPYASAGSN